ncbi:hypothetical protein AAC387_Pa01g3333 [Persea americana]|eukprot:TRINITY_DN14531_c0_g2_i2.p1 TRINITY_DN14531_c0_g2~~TRINITY_DN14531_c0_g2_i2.p1  ORF type:complete len:373 (+),score=72.22 TRINITY_DN14531_c0_g2_i2:226-1344(+)
MRQKDDNFLLGMENSGDFLEWLGPDISNEILIVLEDPSDLVRLSSISRSWRRFVIENGFCKKLCIKMFPEISCFTRVIEISDSLEPIKAGTSNSVNWEYLEMDHKVYAHLARSLMSARTSNDCIETSIHASSTDNDAFESIENTLDPRERVMGAPSYWSSIGEKDPEMPETLTYKLKSKLCIIDEIHIRPFRAYFQPGFPIYSSKAVRFRMGHSKCPLDMRSMDEFMAGQRCNDDNYIWTFVSPIFPMLQENSLQTFKLPKPVICTGGILQVELLGRVQKQEMDDSYYICVCHVKVIGRRLSSIFDVDILDPEEGKLVLKYCMDAEKCSSPRNESEEDVPGNDTDSDEEDAAAGNDTDPDEEPIGNAFYIAA